MSGLILLVTDVLHPIDNILKRRLPGLFFLSRLPECLGVPNEEKPVDSTTGLQGVMSRAIDRLGRFQKESPAAAPIT
jgi:hypothetical protein